MKADWDDAPDHIKLKKRKFPIGIAGITAIGLIGGVIFMADRNGWADFAQGLIAPSQAVSQQQTASTQPATAQHQPATPSPEDTFWEQISSERQQLSVTNPAVRQTSFNDSNYRPRTNINTIQSPPRQYAQTSAQSQSAPRQKGLNGRIQVTLQWEETRGNRTHRWTGYYRFQDSKIIYDDLCSGSARYPAGSIEYRDCRKVAKTYLRNQCRSQSDARYRAMYCFAESSFRH